MNEFLTYLVNGLSLGGIYALIALGFVIVFKSTEVVNFAHGSFVVLGAYVIARVQADAPFAVAVLAGVAATSVGFLLVERLFVRKLLRDQHAHRGHAAPRRMSTGSTRPPLRAGR